MNSPSTPSPRAARSTSRTAQPRPVLKWAGGKRQLMDALVARLPAGLFDGTITRYIEPFTGGGALFFELMHHDDLRLDEIILLDANAHLMTVYEAIRHDVEALIPRLASFQDDYMSRDARGRSALYYATREAFNAVDPHAPAAEAKLDQAARFIFLNKTCFNGLYRVNSRGAFNVPVGRYKRPGICDAPNLRAAAEALSRVTLRCADYSACREHVSAADAPRTLLYFDPPYRPISATANFNEYAGSFDDDAQRDLATLARDLSALGAHTMLSNSDPRSTNPEDAFFDDLYHDFTIARVPARRMINSNAEARGPITELVITSY